MFSGPRGLHRVRCWASNDSQVAAEGAVSERHDLSVAGSPTATLPRQAPALTACWHKQKAQASELSSSTSGTKISLRLAEEQPVFLLKQRRAGQAAVIAGTHRAGAENQASPRAGRAKLLEPSEPAGATPAKSCQQRLRPAAARKVSPDSSAQYHQVLMQYLS